MDSDENNDEKKETKKEIALLYVFEWTLHPYS